MSSSPSQLLLLADHIALSLLERRRAISLNLEPTTAQDANVARSLDTLRSGISVLPPSEPQLPRLRSQYDDLAAQFRGEDLPDATATSAQPNDPSLAPDFAHAQSTAAAAASPPRAPAPAPPAAKSVRFRDDPAADEADAARAALFPYRDSPSPPPASGAQAGFSNRQIHSYHAAVLAEQDAQLDRLGASIGRQRDLSIQIGDELDEHVAMLDDMEEGVDRHQGRLDGVRGRLGRVARRANDNKAITAIVVLIVILVLLIIVLK